MTRFCGTYVYFSQVCSLQQLSKFYLKTEFVSQIIANKNKSLSKSVFKKSEIRIDCELINIHMSLLETER